MFLEMKIIIECDIRSGVLCMWYIASCKLSGVFCFFVFLSCKDCEMFCICISAVTIFLCFLVVEINCHCIDAHAGCLVA